jgi:glutamyl-tRNA reductase
MAAAGGTMLVLGLSHQTARLAARERGALDDARARTVLRGLRDDPSIREAVVLSTCNRTEIYALAESPASGEQTLRRTLLEGTALGAATLACSGYALFERDAAEHLFRVAAGLESAILGETEIAGQVRAAARRARDEAMLGTFLAAAFERSLAAAGRARRRTGISAGATSIASLVAELIGSAAPTRAVLLGAGRLAQSVAGPLAAAPGVELTFVNRTAAGARRLADRHGATAVGLERLEDELSDADVLVCATNAPHEIVGTALIGRATDGRRRPLLIVDLAVPRDVDPAASLMPEVTLYDIDAVQQMVGRNLAARQREAQAAAELVRVETERFLVWRRELDAVPAVRSVWRQAEQLRRAELARIAGALSADERERLEHLTASLLVKLLHGPCERLRAACTMPDGAAHVDTFRMLFGVDADGRGDGADAVVIPHRHAA